MKAGTLFNEFNSNNLKSGLQVSKPILKIKLNDNFNLNNLVCLIQECSSISNVEYYDDQHAIIESNNLKEKY